MPESDTLLKGLHAIRDRAKAVMLECDAVAKLIEEGPITELREACSAMTGDAQDLVRQIKALRVAVVSQWQKLVHLLGKEGEGNG